MIHEVNRIREIMGLLVESTPTYIKRREDDLMDIIKHNISTTAVGGFTLEKFIDNVVYYSTLDFFAGVLRASFDVFDEHKDEVMSEIGTIIKKEFMTMIIHKYSPPKSKR